MNSIVDGLKPENKKWLKAGGIASCLILIVVLIFMLLNDYTYNIKEIILTLEFITIIVVFSLYGYLYGEKYKLEVTTSKIKLRTLFSKIEINI